MVLSNSYGHQYTLTFVLFICFSLTLAHCGYLRRSENRRRIYNFNDHLSGRSNRNDSHNKFSTLTNSPDLPDNVIDKDNNQAINQPSGQLVSSSRITESLSLKSASVDLTPSSRPPLPSHFREVYLTSSTSTTHPPSPSLPPSSPSTITSENKETEPQPQVQPEVQSQTYPQPQTSPPSPPPPSPPKFPGIYDRLSPDMVNIVASNNLFGYKLFKALIQFNGNQNILISPLSLFSTLVTVYAGASTSTEDEMISLLQLKNMNEHQIETAFREVIHTLLYDVGAKNELKLVNSIFADNELNISSSYTNKMRTYYQAQIEKVGFATEPDYVTTYVNRLISHLTNGVIPIILDSTLDPLTRLLLINAIFFKGFWAEPFNPTLTNVQTFRNFDRTTSKVPMMRSTSSINYHCDYDQVKACFIEKLYSGGSLSFLAITPTNGTDITYLESLLGTETMYQMLDQLQDATIELGLPRFSVSGSYDLLKPLELLGMKAAFSPKNADLSKMGDSKELFVKEAKHKTVLQVTEEGSLAAGATVAEIGTRKRSPRIIIDRPFLFLIRDVRTDAILFLGRINSLP